MTSIKLILLFIAKAFLTGIGLGAGFALVGMAQTNFLYYFEAWHAGLWNSQIEGRTETYKERFEKEWFSAPFVRYGKIYDAILGKTNAPVNSPNSSVPPVSPIPQTDGKTRNASVLPTIISGTPKDSPSPPNSKAEPVVDSELDTQRTKPKARLVRPKTRGPYKTRSPKQIDSTPVITDKNSDTPIPPIQSENGSTNTEPVKATEATQTSASAAPIVTVKPKIPAPSVIRRPGTSNATRPTT